MLRQASLRAAALPATASAARPSPSFGLPQAPQRHLATSSAAPAPAGQGEQAPPAPGAADKGSQFGEAFGFVRSNQRPAKPRAAGLTEMRGPYYTPMGERYLRDILEGVGHAVDGLKFAGGAFSVMNRGAVQRLIQVAHEHDVCVSTGGWIEYVLTQGQDTVERYLAECKAVGFDVVELSSGFISLPTDDLVRLIRDVHKAGLKAKPEIGVQFGAGGDSSVAELAAEGLVHPSWAIRKARRCLEAGAHMIMLESEGITEDVGGTWRTDVVAQFVDSLGLEKLMFEAADPRVFSWYVKTFGPEVNLFVDHSQVVQLECLRRGIWGTQSTWGRMLTYKGSGGGAA